MKKDMKTPEPSCRIDAESLNRFKEQLPDIAENIIESCYDKACYTHIDYEPIPSEGYVVDIINKLKEILFPGYFTREKIDPVNLKYYMGQSVSVLFDMLSVQIAHSIRHDCFRYDLPCNECEEQGQKIALNLLESIPLLRKILATDVRAVYDGDPAAKSHDEIIFSYPGIFAVTIYRVAHKLFELQVPLLPRIMTEHAHSLTGIDIHPGADIGESFVIDHGTGVVIGETTVIGKNVRIYQGVTLGALSLPKDAGERLRGKKRHPTIEDDVIVYSGATILGGNTIIGARSVIGGNVWITKSVPPDTKVIMETPKLVYK
ncbi:MAG: serine acetyltransferase [Deltaproteobacteria bacterium]|nr:serine acetyltransferase [Deltaproteobacteria bacterium]MBW1969473.1 serine acetyltransferase [Deltaproteobacteria bacterium]MBW2326089.1 serine acetyltransferase [Deltaproteobacteria bacterium]MDX2497565.1 serine acetyltransferase [Desulfobacterales bacterium]